MFPLSTLSMRNAALLLLFTAALGVDAELAHKPKNENVFYAKPMCANPEKKNSGVMPSLACENAIELLYGDQRANVAGKKGGCHSLATSGDCSVALCNVNTEQAKLPKSRIANIAQQIHAWCKDGGKTAGQVHFQGLQAVGEPHLTGTIWLGKMDGAPRSLSRREESIRGMDWRREASADAKGHPEAETELATRDVGDSKNIGGGWKIITKGWAPWYSLVGEREITDVFAEAQRRWQRDHHGPNPAELIGRNAAMGTVSELIFTAYNNHNLGQMPWDRYASLRDNFIQLWRDQDNPGALTVRVQDNHGNDIGEITLTVHIFTDELIDQIDNFIAGAGVYAHGGKIP